MTCRRIDPGLWSAEWGISVGGLLPSAVLGAGHPLVAHLVGAGAAAVELGAFFGFGAAGAKGWYARVASGRVGGSGTSGGLRSHDGDGQQVVGVAHGERATVADRRETAGVRRARANPDRRL